MEDNVSVLKDVLQITAQVGGWFQWLFHRQMLLNVP